MRQRIAIAIALACRPEAADRRRADDRARRHRAGRDPRLLDRLRREHDLAVVLITHDLGVMSSIADRLSVFYAGRVVESGARDDMLQRPRHPYTRALLDALPHPEAAHERELVAIGGVAADAASAARRLCVSPPLPLRRGSCRTEIPPLVPSAGSTRRARLSCRSASASRDEPARAGRTSIVDYERRGACRYGRSPVRASRWRRARSSAWSASPGAGSRRSRAPRWARARQPAGTVRFEGADVTPLSRRARSAQLVRLQLVFQNPFSSLNPRRRSGPSWRMGSRHPRRRARRAPAARARAARASSASSPGAAERYPHEFSRRAAPAHRDRARSRRRSVGDRARRAARPRSTRRRRRSSRTCSSACRATSRLGLLLISHDLAIVRHVADARLRDVPRHDGRDRPHAARCGASRCIRTARR